MVIIFPTQCKCLLLYFICRVQVERVLGGMDFRRCFTCSRTEILEKEYADFFSYAKLYRRSLKFPYVAVVRDFSHKTSMFCKRITTFVYSLHLCSLSLPALVVGFIFRAFILYGGERRDKIVLNFREVPVLSGGIWLIG